ncbi:MAG: hypothetical protein JO257_18030 [Deltaproteobacteria bacterium]|nr:hypothetical protein [Deltaproteobacteria bacterium]
MRALALLLLASTAHADPLLISASARRACIPAGGDHGEWEGVGLALEPSARARTSLRLYAGIDELTNHSDSATYAYAGYQLTALAGVRVVLAGGPNARLFYAAAVGGGYMRTANPGEPMSASERLYVEPVRFGVEYDVDDNLALRVEAAVDLHWTSYDPIAVIGAGGVAVRL